MAGALRIRRSTTSHRPRRHGAACSRCTEKRPSGIQVGIEDFTEGSHHVKNAGMTCGHARKGRIETRLNTTADCVSPAAWRYALLILLLGPKYSMKCQRLCGLN